MPPPLLFAWIGEPMQLNVEDDRIEFEPTERAEASVIWLHGLGADGYDFEGVLPMLELPPDSAVRFVFPHAPVRPVTVNNGLPMRAWFDISGLDAGAPEDEPGIRASAERLLQLLAREQARGVAAERIVLAGFSQGGAVALHAGLRSSERLAGILALSTWLPLADSLPQEGVAARRDTPVLMMHGVDDPVVPLPWAQRSRDRLLQFGCDLRFETLPMGHSISAAQLTTIGAWLRQRLCG